MKPQQIILIACGIAAILLIYYLGNTIPPHKIAAQTDHQKAAANLTTDSLISRAREGLNEWQLEKLAQLESSMVRSMIKDQQIHVYHQLAKYWKDSLQHPEIAAYYTGLAAMLENSEKNLNFAARQFLNYLMVSDDAAFQHWLAMQAKPLLEKSISLNPQNDSAKIGLGACYLFGNIDENPMQGVTLIQQELKKDSGNVYARIMLGLGSIKSGQYEKAAEHFKAVISKHPENLEAIFHLAETYDRAGDKVNAVKWYAEALKKINLPEAQQELQARINALQQ